MSDQIYLGAARGGKFQEKLSTKRLVIFVSLAPEHDLCCICTVFQGVAFLACHVISLIKVVGWRSKRGARAHAKLIRTVMRMCVMLFVMATILLSWRILKANGEYRITIWRISKLL